MLRHANTRRIEALVPDLVVALGTSCPVLDLQLPEARKEGRILGEGPGAVPALIDALRNEAKVL